MSIERTKEDENVNKLSSVFLLMFAAAIMLIALLRIAEIQDGDIRISVTIVCMVGAALFMQRVALHIDRT